MVEKKKFTVNDEEKRAKCISFRIIYLLKGETYENMKIALKYASELAKKACVNTIKEKF